MKQEKRKRGERREKEPTKGIVLDEVCPWSDTWKWGAGRVGVK